MGACDCATCRLSRGMDALKEVHAVIDGATEQWLNEDCERQMAFAHLRDEVEAVSKSRGVAVQDRLRLREALRVSNV